MSWLIAVFVVAAFALARRARSRAPVERATDLRSWYRAWDRDSANQPATPDELHRLLETYRHGRHVAHRSSSLPDTKRVAAGLTKRWRWPYSINSSGPTE